MLVNCERVSSAELVARCATMLTVVRILPQTRAPLLQPRDHCWGPPSSLSSGVAPVAPPLVCVRAVAPEGEASLGRDRGGKLDPSEEQEFGQRAEQAARRLCVDCGLWIVDCGLCIVDCAAVWTTDCALQRLRTAEGALGV